MTPIVGDPFRQWDASYVLGSLSSTERREYEAHLAECPGCQSAVDELRGIPALLALLRHDDIASIDEQADHAADDPVPAGLLDSLMRTVSARRRRARLVTLAACGLVAATVLASAVLVAVRPSEPRSEPMALEFTMAHVVPSTFDATFSLIGQPWGTQIEMSCTYLESADEADGDADVLALVVVERDGDESVLATWMARTGDTARPSASTALSIDDIGAVKIVEIGTSEVVLQRDL